MIVSMPPHRTRHGLAPRERAKHGPGAAGLRTCLRAVALCVVLSQAIAAAERLSASLTGVVTDAQTGAVLPGSVILLMEQDRCVPADSTGRYVFDDVPAGPQHMIVRRVGYEQRTLHALVPHAGALVIDVSLQPRPILIDSIAVEALVPLRGLGDETGEGVPFPDRGLSMAAVRNHPILSEPDALQAAASGEVGIRPESPSGIHVRGGASDQVAYRLDGIPILNPYYVGGLFGSWNPDALARLDLVTTSSLPQHADALSGVLNAATRAPNRRTRVQGGFSSTQARLALDGPIGSQGAGYLLSGRSAFPGLLFHKSEGSHLRGEGHDWIAKLESPLSGGRLHVLASGMETEINAASRGAGDGTAEPPFERNALSWSSRSLGASWAQRIGDLTLDARVWGAEGRAGGRWAGIDSIVQHLSWSRHDVGLSASVTRKRERATTLAGIRAERSRTRYRTQADSADAPSIALAARSPVVGAFVEREHPVGARGVIKLTLAATLADGELYPNPGLQVRWDVGRSTSVSGGLLRRRQYAQSLRNTESIAATVFPVDLHVDAKAPGVPVARSDLAHLGVEHRPAAGIRLAAQAYVRSSEGLLLVAPAAGGPFATAGFVSGSDRVRGVVVESSAHGARYAAMAAYGYQRARIRWARGEYTPEYGTPHSLDAGVTYYIRATLSMRLGMVSQVGRRCTASFGRLEWEGCNLLDQGCEFSGTVGAPAEPLGATRLPAYHRLDLGFRKHWHLGVAGRDCILAVYGTATNLLARRNVLTVVVDPSTGERSPLEMRPRSPLVIGIEWQL